MLRKLSIWGVVWAVWLVSVPGAFAQEARDFPGAIQANIQAGMDELTIQHMPPGMVVWVDAPMLHFAAASGYANLHDETPMPVDGAFKIGSITKLFTATLILQLMEEGTLTLDDPLMQWLPDVAAELPFGDQIMLRQLLNHTAGVYNYTDHPELFTDTLPRLQLDFAAQQARSDCQAQPHQLTLTRYAYGQPAVFEPGQTNRYAYSNTHYILLGMVIEAATGQPLADVYHARIFDPLGLTETYLECDEPATGHLVGGYMDFVGMEYEVSGIGETAMHWAAGGLVSTVSDLTIFARALFTGQLFADPATLDLMVAPLPFAAYGFGVEVTDDYWGHGGGTTGYVSWLEYQPAHDAVLIIFFNRENSTSRIRQLVRQAMAGRLDQP